MTGLDARTIMSDAARQSNVIQYGDSFAVMFVSLTLYFLFNPTP